MTVSTINDQASVMRITNLASAILFLAAPAVAQSPREALVQASFADTDRASALAHVVAIDNAAAAVLRRAPADYEAALIEATTTGYRAKLTGSRTLAIAARRRFEALVERNPSDADAQLGLGAWHIGAVYNVGRIVASAALGASRGKGFAALDRAVAEGGGRAAYAGIAGLLRLELDPDDAKGRALAEAATRAATPTRFDRIMQHAAALVLVPLRAGDEKTVKALAARLLPFGRVPKD